MLPKKKQLSGAKKRRKKKESDLKILALKGSLNNFFTSSSNVDVSLISFLFEVHAQAQHIHPEIETLGRRFGPHAHSVRWCCA